MEVDAKLHLFDQQLNDGAWCKTDFIHQQSGSSRYGKPSNQLY